MLNSWKDKLEHILARSQDSDPIALIMELRGLGLAMGHEVGDALLASHPEFFAHRPALTEAFRKMVYAQDVAEIAMLLRQEVDGPVSFQNVAAKNTNIGLMSSNYAYNRLNEVFDRLDFSGCQQVVMVGCGGRPFTMFRFHDQTTIPRIIGLDIVPEAVETANTLAARLGYPRIRAELCNGLDYDYGQAQVVYIANMVSPKAAVVARVADTAPDDVTIIVWDPCSLGRLWADRAEDALDSRLEVTGRTAVSQTMTRDIVLRRRTPGAGKNLG
jgi:hypothetical protein